MAARIIDISVALENDIASDPPGKKLHTAGALCLWPT